MRHPLVGPLVVTQQTLTNGAGPRIVVATAVPGSPSHTTLALLAHATASAASFPLCTAQIVQHFDLDKGQTPEGIVLAPDGIAYVTFAKADGTLYFGYATGTADLTGVWSLRPGGTPQRIAPLPANSLPGKQPSPRP